MNGNNSGFQIMLHNKKNGDFKDMATYDVPNLNIGVSGKEAWKLEYTFDPAHGIDAYHADNLLTSAAPMGSGPAVRKKFDDYFSMQTFGQSYITPDNWKIFQLFANSDGSGTIFELCSMKMNQ